MDLDALIARIPGASRVADNEPTGAPDDLWPTPHGDHPPATALTELPAGYQRGMPPMVTADGLVAAEAWPYDRCHISFTNGGVCWKPTPSSTDNGMFHQGHTVTADGASIPTGLLCIEGGHAPEASDATVAEAQRHYSDPDRAIARGRIVETPESAFFVGALIPGTTHADVAKLRAGGLSGDWRYIPELGRMDALGPVLVNRRGLPSSVAADASDAGNRSDWVAELDGPDGSPTSARLIPTVLANAGAPAPMTTTTVSLALPAGLSPLQAQAAVDAAAKAADETPCCDTCSGTVTATAGTSDGPAGLESQIDALANRLDAIEEAVGQLAAQMIPDAPQLADMPA